MIYSPHILQIKETTESVDEWGNPIVSNPIWRDVGECRCDDNTTKEFRSENGSTFRPAYHIVGESLEVKPGDEIRCMYDNKIRGEGKVYAVKQSNYLDYTEIWV